jgi:hypothetical protein
MNDENLPTTYDPSDDGIALVADPPADTLRTKYLSFKKGKWLLGSEATKLDDGSRFVLHGARQGWVRLIKGETPRRIPREPGQPFPTRNELGDTDQSK